MLARSFAGTQRYPPLQGLLHPHPACGARLGFRSSVLRCSGLLRKSKTRSASDSARFRSTEHQPLLSLSRACSPRLRFPQQAFRSSTGSLRPSLRSSQSKGGTGVASAMHRSTLQQNPLRGTLQVPVPSSPRTKKTTHALSAYLARAKKREEKVVD